ncbi:MAG TPA: hypothetical protein PKN36_06205 [bacterium]|nr:hypothetical protein [bacterium]
MNKEMKWLRHGNGYAGEENVEIRSLKIRDSFDAVKRFRTCTVFKNFVSFSTIPAQGRLFKSENGQIGVLVTGRHEGYVKMGKSFLVNRTVVVGLDSLSRKALKKLIDKKSIYIVEIDGTSVGFER